MRVNTVGDYTWTYLFVFLIIKQLKYYFLIMEICDEYNMVFDNNLPENILLMLL